MLNSSDGFMPVSGLGWVRQLYIGLFRLSWELSASVIITLVSTRWWTVIDLAKVYKALWQRSTDEIHYNILCKEIFIYLKSYLHAPIAPFLTYLETNQAIGRGPVQPILNHYTTPTNQSLAPLIAR